MRLLQLISLLVMVMAATVAMGQEDVIFWEDREIAQLENMTPDLLGAVERLRKQFSSIALSSVNIDENLSPRLRRVLITRIYQLMTKGANLNMVKCEDCSQIRSELVGSILKISRGVADDDFRREKAKELNVQGFLDLDVFISETQLSISMTAYEAQEGKVVFSEIVLGNPVNPIRYFHAYLGKYTSSITYDASGTTLEQSAYIIGQELVNRLSESWKYSVGVAFLIDDTSEAQKSSLEGDAASLGGFLVDGQIGWDALSSLGNRLKISLNLGLGLMLGNTDLGSPSFLKPGVAVSVGNNLTIDTYYLLYTTESPSSGGGYYFALGWQF